MSDSMVIKDLKDAYYMHSGLAFSADETYDLWAEFDARDRRIASLEAEVETLKAERRWIPVSERLPELGSPILFYDSILERINKGTCTAKNSDNTNLHWFTDDDLFYFGDRSEYVTHWMPLPEYPNDTQKDTVVYGKERER